jgi:hypothetical protein
MKIVPEKLSLYNLLLSLWITFLKKKNRIYFILEYHLNILNCIFAGMMHNSVAIMDHMIDVL